MAKEFYTERDIEDLVRRGASSLDINDDVVLTEMAYEKARSLGLKLVRPHPENRAAAAVRLCLPQKDVGPAAGAEPCPAAPEKPDLEQRIRGAVIARLGAQVDSNLLDVIIRRVLAGTGVK